MEKKTKVAHYFPERHRVAQQLRKDADLSARLGDRSVGDRNWKVAETAYGTARDLNTAARQLELDRPVDAEFEMMVRQVRGRVMKEDGQ